MCISKNAGAASYSEAFGYVQPEKKASFGDGYLEIAVHDIITASSTGFS